MAGVYGTDDEEEERRVEELDVALVELDFGPPSSCSARVGCCRRRPADDGRRGYATE
jgi:hypothetical protein